MCMFLESTSVCSITVCKVSTFVQHFEPLILVNPMKW